MVGMGSSQLLLEWYLNDSSLRGIFLYTICYKSESYSMETCH